mgnify:CR=1 FL=1
MKEYEVDCIIYASGFEITSSYQRRIGFPIYGVEGESIYDHWSDGMCTMHGLMAHGFPNLFFCGGLFVFQLGVNYCYGVDVQAKHVAYTVSELMKRNIQITTELYSQLKTRLQETNIQEAERANDLSVLALPEKPHSPAGISTNRKIIISIAEKH